MIYFSVTPSNGAVHDNFEKELEHLFDDVKYGNDSREEADNLETVRCLGSIWKSFLMLKSIKMSNEAMIMSYLFSLVSQLKTLGYPEWSHNDCFNFKCFRLYYFFIFFGASLPFSKN